MLVKGVRRLSFVLACVLTLAACSTPDDEPSTEETATTVVASSTTEITGLRTATGAAGAPRDPSLGLPGEATGSDPSATTNLPIGSCFRQFFVDATDGRTERMRTVACDEPHDGEVFALSTYPGRGGLRYPGDDEVERYTAVTCVEQFESYVGREFALSQFRISRLQPDESSWDDGDRLIRCSLYDKDLFPLTESARGSNQ